ncbi:AfsR/SARP family transcriptional regulator [Virgisporangium aurantiacum]|nr:BTAD domain-containing putative transcriptional regulator [Virgisporangium aurantiacum]
MTNGVELNVLGPWEVRVDQRPVTIPSGRLQALLAALVLSEGQPVPVRTLADQLWSDEPPQRAGATVHTYVTRLRKLLGTGVIRTVSGGYLFCVAAECVDLYRFRQLVRATAAAGPSERELELLQRALLLWRGRPFGDAESNWLDREVVPRLTEEWFAATERRIDIEVAIGPPAGVIAELFELTNRYPTRESLWVRLISALHRSGRRGEALEAYRQVREILSSELGLDPSEQLSHLQQAVLRDEPVRPVPGHDAPPTVGQDVATVAPAQLPADVTDFAGRADELATLCAIKPAADGVTVTVVTGTAGVGKTTLAVRWAHRVAGEFPDGQLFVNLRGYAPDRPVRPVEALAWFLGALGVPPDRVPPDVDAAAALYRSMTSRRRMLVVLDNAGDAEQVRPLLPTGAGSLVVVTSRRLLTGLVVTHSAHHLAVAPLTADDAVRLVTRILGTGRAEPHAVRALAQQCSYLPLALRIAAANLRVDRHLDLGGYLGQLRDGGQLATLTVDGDPSASVRAALDWSYLRLSPHLRHVFRHLGLVPGPDVTAEAVAALIDTSAEEAGRWLRTLADVNLVEATPHRRYTFHDLLKAYAAERVRTEDAEADRVAAVRRLLGWYLHHTVAAVELLYPLMLRLPAPPPGQDTPSPAPASCSEALAWLTVERSNLVEAVSQAATDGHHEYAWRLADALRGYFDGTGHRVDWLTVAEAAMTAATAGGDPVARAAAAANLAHVHQFCGDGRAALDHVTASLRLSREGGWAEGEARALNHLGALHVVAGRPQRAIEAFVDALASDRRAGYDHGVATRLVNLGVTSMSLGRLDVAEPYLREALDIHRRTGCSQAWVLGNLAVLQQMVGALEAAFQDATLARAEDDEDADQRTDVFNLAVLSAIERDRGRLAEAERYADLAETVARRVGAPVLVMTAANNRGAVDLHQARYEKAAERYREAQRTADDGGNGEGSTVAQIGLAQALCGLGQHAEATTHADAARTTAETSGYRIQEAGVHVAMAEIALGRHRRTGEPTLLQGALGHAEWALTLYRDIGYRINEARTLILLGDIGDTTGTPAAGERHRRAAFDLATTLGVPRAAFPCRPRHTMAPGGDQQTDDSTAAGTVIGGGVARSVRHGRPPARRGPSIGSG